MSGEQNLVVLRCELCNKPFNKESTLKRHGYYCRTRKGHSSGTRTRSCLACARAKARCDAESSSCSRCITKGLHCKYPGGTTSSSAALRPKPATAGPAQPDSPHEDVVPSSTIIEDDFPDAEDIDIDFDISDLNRGQLSWDLISTEVNSTPDLAFNQDQPLLNLVSTPITSQQSSSSSPQYSPISALSAMPLYHLRAFAQNPMTKSGPANTTSILMMRILTSYPTMLRDLSNLPPFIHPLFLAGQEKGGKSLESLTTCVSLIQMLNSGIQGSKKLVWKNVRLECERLQVQWTELDAWDLLSSMQALLMYMLLRLQDGETAYNDFDVLLLSTMWVVGCAMNDRIVNYDCSSPRGLGFGTTYSEWVFEESRRRLGLVFRIIGMIFFTDPAAACTLLDGFLISPLPSPKQLWEARDEAEWAARKSFSSEREATYGIRPGGQMGKLQSSHAILPDVNDSLWEQPTESESNTHWQEWSSGMDGLGALIMLAASLPIQV